MRGWWRRTEPSREALRPTWCWPRWSPSWPGKETPRWTFPCAYPADAELGRRPWAPRVALRALGGGVGRSGQPGLAAAALVLPVALDLRLDVCHGGRV